MTLDDLPCDTCRVRHHSYHGEDCLNALKQSTPQAYIQLLISKCTQYNGRIPKRKCKHGPLFRHWEAKHKEIFTLALLAYGGEHGKRG